MDQAKVFTSEMAAATVRRQVPPWMLVHAPEVVPLSACFPTTPKAG
jgi:hypothetical protein